MSLHTVVTFLADQAPDLTVIEFESSTATVGLAAEALGVTPGQIAKTLSMRVADQIILLVTRGDARLDNRKFKEQFGVKAKMLERESVEPVTSHPVGGVCPFGLPDGLSVFLDVSLRDFSIVFPAGGAANSAVKVAPERMAEVVSGQWVDVCRDDEPVPGNQ